VLDRNPIARSMLRTLFEPRVARLRFAGGAGEALAMLEAGGVTHLLADEGTLKAEADGPAATLRSLRAVGGSAAFFTLWLKPDPETKDELIAASDGKVVEKPITGTGLIDVIIPPSEENSERGSSDPLVSRAA
jgi:CheY-like chemotaxis protein